MEPNTVRLSPSKSSTPTTVSNIFANFARMFNFVFFSSPPTPPKKKNKKTKNKPTQSATIVLTLWIYCTEGELKFQFGLAR